MQFLKSKYTSLKYNVVIYDGREQIRTCIHIYRSKQIERSLQPEISYVDKMYVIFFAIPERPMAKCLLHTKNVWFSRDVHT